MSRRNPLFVPVEFQDMVDQLMLINEDYVKRYTSQILELEKYKIQHPTKMLVFKCGDGRLLFAGFCETKLGYLRNFRNIGGKFNFGWKALRDVMTRMVQQAHDEKKGCLAIITYHFSKGDNKHRGCAGHKYDIAASLAGATGFKRQLERAYRGLEHQIIPIVVGIETDEEALIFHNDHDEKVIDVAKLPTEITEEEVFLLLSAQHAEMPLEMRLDLLPLIMGNIRHRAKVIESKRPIVEMEHNEWIIGVGGATAFDFLHVPNTAIIVGQYNPNLEKVIRQALGVIKNHWKPGKKFLSLAAAIYSSDKSKHLYEQHAMEDVRYYNRLTREVAQEYYRELVPHMHQVRALVDVETQKMKRV